MKVKTLIGYLEQFEPEDEVEVREMSDLYETILIAIREENSKVVLNIKNIFKDQIKKDVQ